MAILTCLGLGGCQVIMDLLSTDTVIDVTCYDADGDGNYEPGDDTVILDGVDLCQQYKQRGSIDCSVGYRIRIDGTQVCP